MSKPGSRCLTSVDGHKSEADCDEPSPSKTASGQPAHASKPKRPTSSSSKSRGPSRKRPREYSPGDGTGQEEGSGYVVMHSKQQSPEVWFACPFFKHDPSSCRGSRSCQTRGWTSIVRLKEHIKRNHEKNMNGWQIDQLRSRAKYSSKPDVERWREIYNILFPTTENPPTPYCFDPSNDPEGFGSYLNHEVLGLLRGKLADDSMFNGSPMLMQRIPEIVSECMTTAIKGYQHPQLNAPEISTSNESSASVDCDQQNLHGDYPSFEWAMQSDTAFLQTYMDDDLFGNLTGPILSRSIDYTDQDKDRLEITGFY